MNVAMGIACKADVNYKMALSYQRESIFARASNIAHKPKMDRPDDLDRDAKTPLTHSPGQERLAARGEAALLQVVGGRQAATNFQKVR